MATMVLDVETDPLPQLNSEMDFPRHFQDMAHPDDFKITNAPIQPEFIMHIRRGHTKMICRFSWKLADNKYCATSFVVATCVPKHFYLSVKTIDMLDENNRIVEDDIGYCHIQLSDKKVRLGESNQPANIIGLDMVRQLGAIEFPDEHSWRFARTPAFL